MIDYRHPGQRAEVLAVLLFLLIFPLGPASGGSRARHQPEHGLIPVNGTALYYESIGRGPTILIVHGGPGLDHTYLLPQMARLSDHYRLIFYDMRGSGKSSVDPDTTRMTLDNLVKDIEGLRVAFKLGEMNLLGHSFGGLLAMFYATRYPQNLNSLLLVNPTPARSEYRDASFKILKARRPSKDSISLAAITRTDAFNRREPRAMEQFYRIFFRTMFYHEAMVDSLTLTLSPEYQAQSKLLIALYNDENLKTYDLLPALDSVRCPTLIVTGDHDMVPREGTEEIRDHIHGSRLVVLKDCGHFPFVEAPDDFFSAVRSFLAAVKH